MLLEVEAGALCEGNGRGTGSNDLQQLYLLFPSSNTTCCSLGNALTRGMGPGNPRQAGDKDVLENRT